MLTWWQELDSPVMRTRRLMKWLMAQDGGALMECDIMVAVVFIFIISNRIGTDRVIACKV